MKRSRFGFYACCLVLVAGCGSPQQGTVVEEKATSSAAPSGAEGGNVVDVPGYPERPFIRVNLDKVTWRATEGNKLGVQTAILEGDPSKPGFYVTINRFPPYVMSRPHYHPDERNAIVLRGTWYTGEGDSFEPTKTVGLKPGDYMRHPKGGNHYDGALEEEVLVAIMGHGPTSATVIGGGDLFAPAK
jgi:quercetin dioxygenase-like cupin family protein